MKTIKKYRYIGLNGVITTNIILKNEEKIDVFELVAEPGFILTNGNAKLYYVTVLPEEISNWIEIPDESEK